LTPDHNTINNFRKDNAKALREVFNATVTIAKNFDLIGGKLLAGDSTKFRAQNSNSDPIIFPFDRIIELVKALYFKLISSLK
jgi:hypothetical protein